MHSSNKLSDLLVSIAINQVYQLIKIKINLEILSLNLSPKLHPKISFSERNEEMRLKTAH